MAASWTTQNGIVVTADTTNPVKGSTVVEDSIRYQVADGFMRAEYRYEQSNAGTAGSGAYRMRLPTGWQFDPYVTFVTDIADSSTFARGALLGSDVIGNNGASGIYHGVLLARDASTFSLLLQGPSAVSMATGQLVDEAFFGFGIAGLKLRCSLSVPVIPV